MLFVLISMHFFYFFWFPEHLVINDFDKISFKHSSIELPKYVIWIREGNLENNMKYECQVN